MSQAKLEETEAVRGEIWMTVKSFQECFFWFGVASY